MARSAMRPNRAQEGQRRTSGHAEVRHTAKPRPRPANGQPAMAKAGHTAKPGQKASAGSSGYGQGPPRSQAAPRRPAKVNRLWPRPSHTAKPGQKPSKGSTGHDQAPPQSQTPPRTDQGLKPALPTQAPAQKHAHHTPDPPHPGQGTTKNQPA